MKCCSEYAYQFASLEMESSFALFASFLCLLFLIIILRIMWVISSRRFEACNSREASVKMLVVVGSGGHTMEIIELLRGLSQRFSPKVYIIADTDNKSNLKVLDFEKELESKFGGKSKYEIKRVPRSREVGQSYFTSVFSTIFSSLISFYVVATEKPDLILCNGPGTCVPICLSGFLLKVLMVKDMKIIYVESICRVKTLSLSAKILYYFVDRLIVQWPYLYEKYHRTVYLGRIV